MTRQNDPLKLLISGPFVLDTETMRLTRKGAPTEVRGRPLRILELLFATPGRVVTRSDLKAALWPGTSKIDTERRLNTAIRDLRDALGDSGTSPQYIETIRGRGYRWIGEDRSKMKSKWSMQFLALAACSALFLVGSVSRHVASDPLTPEQREHFLRIVAVAESDPVAAAADLETLVQNRSDYRPALVLRAELAMRAWKAAPSAELHAASKLALSEALARVSSDPDLDVLAAELAQNADWDWAQAERLYLRAIAQDPKHVGARRGLAWLYLNTGRDSAAWSQLELLMSEIVLTNSVRADLGWLLLRMGREDLALAMCPEGPSRHLNLLSCRHTAQARSGLIDKARTTAVVLLETLGVESTLVSTVKISPANVGYKVFLQWRAENLITDSGHWFQRAQLQAEAGSLDTALLSLERAYAMRDPLMIKLQSSKEFARLSGSSTYQTLLREVYASDGS